MKKIDKTKNNIHVDKLNENTRKELFSKFVEAGGHVTSDDEDKIIKKATKAKHVFDRDKQLEFKLKEESHRNALKGTVKAEVKNAQFISSIKKPGLLTFFSQKLLIRFRLYFMNITDFSAVNFNNKFFQSFDSNYKTALMRIRSLYLEIFKQNRDIGLQILLKLDKINSLDIKLIEKISAVYNEVEINNIISDYNASHEASHAIDKIREPILALFRKLYLLKPFDQKIYLAFEKGITVHMELTKSKSSEYKLKRKNLKNDLYIIFEKLYFILYWLFNKYNNKIIPLGSYEIEEILKIDKSKKQKNNIYNESLSDAIQPENDQSENKKIDEETKDEIKTEKDTELSIEIKTGIDLLSSFNLNNIEKLRALYDKSKAFAHVKNNDKILFTYLIFTEFDIEYSFLLTTNKIKYKFDYTSSDHVSLKEKLLKHYDEIKKCMDLLREYSNIYELCIKTENEKPLTNDRYISYIKNLNALIKKRNQIANTARFAVLNFMNDISNIFHTLIEDIKGFNKLVENPDEIIEFEVSSDNNRILNKKSILEALIIAYNFAQGFKFRLGSQGDLSGNIEFNESDKKPVVSIKEEVSTIEIKKDSNILKSEESSKKIKEESIIDELDDIFLK